MTKFFLRNDASDLGLQEAAQALLAGTHRHDMLQEAIGVVEHDESNDSVGFGGFPNLEGVMELDAGFMDGNTLDVGAVAAVTNYLPLRIARLLMEKGGPVLLAGQGAEKFAQECGLKTEKTLSDKQAERWKRNIQPRLAAWKGSRIDLTIEITKPGAKLDTTVMIASDGKGVSAATSTSGWPYKVPGRIGDSPIAGAGYYADSRYGGCVCTNTGEMSIRATTATSVVMRMQNGYSVSDAVKAEAEKLLNLKTGLLRGLCIYAIDPAANDSVVAINIDKPVSYQFWREGMPKPELRQAQKISL